MINPRPEKRYSPRYLSEDERIRLADLRGKKLSIRAIADLMDRSPSTISREGSAAATPPVGTEPHEAHRWALARHRVRRPSRLCGEDELREWVATKLRARWLCAESIYLAV